MSDLDDLKAVIADHQKLADNYRRVAAGSHDDVIAANHEVAVALQAKLKAISKHRKHPELGPLSEAEAARLDEAISARGAELDRCKKAEEVALKAAEDAESELAESERAWPPDLGPFPGRNP
jgi:hypothetical protein